MRSPQIPLPLEPRRPDRFEDFVAGPNSAALAAVRQLLEKPGESLFLYGPEGSGKSHLLNALCNAARSQGLAAFYIPLKRLPEGAAAGLEGLQKLDLVCVDDLDCIAGKPVWEEALFRCFNEVRAARGRLVVASRTALAALNLGLPDLESRLAWGGQQKLQLPDDAQKEEILRRRAQSLRIAVPDDVQKYLMNHARRDLASLLQAMERLKDAAFSDKRRITVPLAREILDGAAGDDGAGH